jgi:hypothetical protein
LALWGERDDWEAAMTCVDCTDGMVREPMVAVEHVDALKAAARRISWRTVTHWVLLAGALSYLAWRIPGMAGEFVKATRQVDDVHWVWVGVAVGSGVVALAAYGELHRQLLLVGGARVPAATVQAISFAENAVSTTVPVVGGAGSLGYAIDQLRRRGVGTAAAAWSVLMAGAITTVTLLVLGAIGLAWAGVISVTVAVLAALTVTFGVIGCWLVLTHPDTVHRLSWADSVVHKLSAQVASMRPSGSRWLVLIGVALLSWALDFGTLVASAAAVDARVRLSVLVVGFLVVQASIALQILPGGAGLAEAGLLGVLLGAGVAPAFAAATALTYRLISWLGLSLIGWAAYALTHHAGHVDPEPQFAPAPAGRHAAVGDDDPSRRFVVGIARQKYVGQPDALALHQSGGQYASAVAMAAPQRRDAIADMTV